MDDATGKLSKIAADDCQRAVTAISEAVWWATIVDATLVRHHLQAYDKVLDSHPLTERQRIEATSGGLRFVRNQIGDHADLAEFIEPAEHPAGKACASALRWRPVPEPPFGRRPARAQEWERGRYHAYRAALEGCPIGECFARAAQFLTMTAAMCLQTGREHDSKMVQRTAGRHRIDDLRTSAVSQHRPGGSE